jgi:class 3 adenylate cyclase/pimeloyl-ACP methyl ester carboxylesterase
VKPPPVRYIETPDGAVAYQVLGDGPTDLLFLFPGGSQLDLIWDHPVMERFLRRLASFSRLLIINPRGVGLSDPVTSSDPPTLEEWTSVILPVLGEIKSQGVTVYASGDAGVFAIMFAASHPELTRGLILQDCYAVLGCDGEHTCGLSSAAVERITKTVVDAWGSGHMLSLVAPEHAADGDLREWWARLERATGSRAAVKMMRSFFVVADARGALASVRAPTVVIAHAGDPYIRPAHSRYLADHIAGARYIEREGFFGLPWLHDVEWTLGEIQEFCTGRRGTPELDDRVLATVLFTDIVGSTARAADLGDHRWRRLLEEHDALSAREIERFRGRLVKSTGDGVLATFDGPARATRCALALARAVRPLDIQLRVGVHTGEVEQRDQDVHGIAVHIAERVMSAAAAGEVLVSSSVPPLVAGSGIEFDDRGVQELKGVPGDWRLFAVRT